MRLYKKIAACVLAGCMAFAFTGCGGDTAVSVKEGQDVIEIETEEDDSAQADAAGADGSGSDEAGNNETVGNDNESGVGGNENGEAEKSQDNASEHVSYGVLSEGNAAPDFAADLVSGEKFVLSENQGKVVLLNLWATWCGPCVEEMPAFEKLNSEYGDDVVILGVNCVESKKTVDAFVSENGYTFPIAYDLDGIITNRYPTQGIPYTLVIGKDGVIDNIYLGSLGMEQQYQTYKAAIDAALGE